MENEDSRESSTLYEKREAVEKAKYSLNQVGIQEASRKLSIPRKKW